MTRRHDPALVALVTACHCYWCADARKPHPTTAPHDLQPIGSRLLIAESLDPDDRIAMTACVICGHQQPVENVRDVTTERVRLENSQPDKQKGDSLR